MDEKDKKEFPLSVLTRMAKELGVDPVKLEIVLMEIGIKFNKQGNRG